MSGNIQTLTGKWQGDDPGPGWKDLSPAREDASLLRRQSDTKNLRLLFAI